MNAIDVSHKKKIDEVLEKTVYSTVQKIANERYNLGFNTGLKFVSAFLLAKVQTTFKPTLSSNDEFDLEKTLKEADENVLKDFLFETFLELNQLLKADGSNDEIL